MAGGLGNLLPCILLLTRIKNQSYLLELETDSSGPGLGAGAAGEESAGGAVARGFQVSASSRDWSSWCIGKTSPFATLTAWLWPLRPRSRPRPCTGCTWLVGGHSLGALRPTDRLLPASAPCRPHGLPSPRPGSGRPRRTFPPLKGLPVFRGQLRGLRPALGSLPAASDAALPPLHEAVFRGRADETPLLSSLPGSPGLPRQLLADGRARAGSCDSDVCAGRPGLAGSPAHSRPVDRPSCVLRSRVGRMFLLKSPQSEGIRLQAPHSCCFGGREQSGGRGRREANPRDDGAVGAAGREGTVSVVCVLVGSSLDSAGKSQGHEDARWPSGPGRLLGLRAPLRGTVHMPRPV